MNEAPATSLHPVLAHTRFRRARVSYDVTQAPSAAALLDHSTRAPLPGRDLAATATSPAAARLVLTSRGLPWRIVLAPAPDVQGAVMTNADVLRAVHVALAAPATRAEWDALDTKAQKRVSAAFEARCKRSGQGREGGLRRVDWLEGRTRLVGVRMDRPGEGRLVFRDPK
jgi:hypothetical protein